MKEILKGIAVTKVEQDDFELISDLYAIKNNSLFRIYKSQRSFYAGGCLGSFKIIVDKDYSILFWIYPMMGGGDFELVSLKTVEKWRQYVKLFEGIN